MDLPKNKQEIKSWIRRKQKKREDKLRGIIRTETREESQKAINNYLTK